ncbi:MAG: YlbF family regulator [Chloroflexota bacterium]
MLSTELNEAAVTFGRALRQAHAVAAYRVASDALDADPTAQGLLADLRERQTSFSRMQQAGLAPSQEQIDRLRLAQSAIRANETIMAHLRAASEVKAYLPTVAAHVSAALGADFAAQAAQASC